MPNLKRMLFPLLLNTKKMPNVTQKIVSSAFLLPTFLLPIGWQVLLTQNASAQMAPMRQQLSWQRIFQENDPPIPQKPGGGRPLPTANSRNLCGLTPDQSLKNQQVWSNRPLFVWQGEVERIEVREPLPSGEVLWKQAVTPNQRSISYGGEPLQPGRYNWIIFDRQNRPFVFQFTVMDAEQRQTIEKDLQQLEEKLNTRRTTAEERALHRAQYFAQQQLWSDFWQEIFSVKNPSAALSEIVQTKTAELCRKAAEQNATSSR